MKKFEYGEEIPMLADARYRSRISVRFYRKAAAGFLYKRNDKKWEYYYPRGGPMKTYATLEDAKTAIERYYEEYW